MKWLKKITTFFFGSYALHRSRTVRYAFPMLFIVATFLGANVINSNTESFIHIEASDTSIKAGDAFTIDVFVSAHTPVNAVDISLDFPKEQIEITGIDVGQSVITLWTEEPYVENNSIKAQAKTSGIASFEIADVVLLAGDGTGSSVAVSNSGKESAKLYIAKEDGTFTLPTASGIEGSVTLRIVTDIDGDGVVSLVDVSRFMSAWTAGTTIYDFSGDGRMTFKDFAIILADSFFK